MSDGAPNSVTLSPPPRAAVHARPHPLLSQRLERLLSAAEPQRPLTLNALLERTEGRGIYLVVIVLCLPFITPLPLPAVSSFLGLVMILLLGRSALGLPPRLPKIVGERPIAWSRHPKLVRGSVRLVRFIEKWAKPRRSEWLQWPTVPLANACLLVLMALLLALPLPLPFTNTLPCYAIIFTAASLMEEDGRLIWLGYGFALATVAYYLFLSGAIAALFLKYFGPLWSGG